MAKLQKVIAARDVDITFTLHASNTEYTITTASNFSASITGNTEDIGAISTDEPIATDNGGNTYDLSFSLQEAEAILLKDAFAAATLDDPSGPLVHIRQIVEGASIAVTWNQRRAVPAQFTTEVYNNCTGVEEGDSIERRSVETIKNWRFRARGMSRTTTLI